MSESEKTRFSIVIPCYNEANYLAATLDSLKSQTTKEKYEVIVVDNNCNDETVQIAKSYGAIIVNEKNAGVCWARQAGTKAARGEIVISTDADTIFAPNWLSTIGNKFRDNKQLVAVAGPCRYYDGPWWGKSYPHILFTSVYLCHLLTGHPYYITATNIAFKKSAFVGYDVGLTQGGDELGLLHGLRKVGKIQFVNSNPVYTSARRLTRGLVYNLLVTFLFYYLGAYYINRLFKKTIIGAAPAFREKGSVGNWYLFSNSLVTCSVLVLLVAMSIVPLRRGVIGVTHNISHTARYIVSGIF